jgi:hypothetical protein
MLGFQPYYDEAGTYHCHNPNRHITFFQCSNGHQFTHIYYNACPSCGAVREPDRIEVTPPPCGVPSSK